ncbi:exodeoxyribonuclease V subunit gamma [soil metagenome]
MPAASRLQLYTSNRQEILAHQLAQLLAQPLRATLKPEIVVVPSLGLSRWLTQQLATRHGICANIQFLFAQKFVATLLDEALPDRSAGHFYTREMLTWRVMGLLPPLLDQPEFAELHRYIIDRPRTELRLFQLAGKIATAFDQYLAYRPKLILEWERGAEQHWQAILWRDLTRSAPGLHPPALFQEWIAALRKHPPQLPERVAFFGISTLPEFYLQFLQELAGHTDVHLFLLQPTPEWWSDIRSEREELRARKKASPDAQLHLHFERGNPLLAAWGKTGREFLEIISDLTPAREHDHAQEPKGDTILTQIQRDIFRLDPARPRAVEPARPRAVEPARPRAGMEPARPRAEDPTLQFHSCHTPMREMEVLHDQLLALFEKYPTLKPHDIVVMAPDISAYAPFIEAVFATPPEQQRLPFSIADRPARAENGLLDTFLRILESATSRFPASSVLALLESTALQRRFRLVDADLETIRTWIEKTGIRWGIDAAHRAELGLPAFHENSWRAGLDRLLLGYATPAHGAQLFDGILAYDEVEGSLAETLGGFVDFAEALFATARESKAARPLLAWQELLREITARFFDPTDEHEPEMRQLRWVIDSLGELPDDDSVTLDVLLAHLEQALAATDSGRGFLAGRVTFCALQPMRTVPFRVVCLVGMNDTAFPRHSTAPAFDLIAQQPQRGDRHTRDDDRYLFLEALLAARDVFYLSYRGRSIRDNSKLPPSVLVTDLLDYTGARVTEHPLQPFSRRYFTRESELFSFSSENCGASAAAATERAEPPPFISGKIAKPEAEWERLDTQQLVSFFGNPAKFLIEKRLGLRLPRLEALLQESEPLELATLPKFWLQQDLLGRALRGEALDPLLPIVRAGGELPPGHAGESRLRHLCDNARNFAALVRQYVSGTPADPQQLQLTTGRFELAARIDNLHDGQLVRYRLTRRKPKDLLRTWVDHLLVNCTQPVESVLITATKDNAPKVERFSAVENARARLNELLNLYWRGLREPLPFFPRSSLAYAEQMLGVTRSKFSPLQQAQRAWGRSPKSREPDFGERPEREDKHFDLAFRNVPEPLGAEFQELAMQVFDPVLQARMEVS